MKLPSLRLTAKIWIALVVSVTGTGVLATLSVSTISAVRIKSAAYNRINQAHLLLADILPPPAYVVEARLVSFELASATTPEARTALEDQLSKLRSDFDGRSTHWKQNSLGTEFDRLLVDSDDTAREYFEAVESQLIPAIESGNQSKAQSLLAGDLATIYDAHRAAVDKVVEHSETYAEKAENDAVHTLSTRTRILWGAIATIVASTVVLGSMIVRGLTRQLQGASGSLADAAKRLASSAKAIRREASKTAEQSSEVANTGDNVASGIATIAAATEELTASIGEISRAASEAVNVANQAAEEAASAIGIVDKLHDSSGQITSVIELISTIAEQTNLLALNATIEAARAGEAGQGFAVVAHEVKELASRTSVATGEIAESIRGVQHETVVVMESIRRVADIVSQINDIQTTVAGAVEEQVATTNEIARSLNAASDGTAAVTTAITTVAASAEGVQANAMMAENVSRDLDELTAELAELVGTASTGASSFGRQRRAARSGTTAVLERTNVSADAID